MALNTLKCNHSTPLDLKGLNSGRSRTNDGTVRHGGMFRRLPPSIRAWYRMESSWRADVVLWCVTTVMVQRSTLNCCNLSMSRSVACRSVLQTCLPSCSASAGIIHVVFGRSRPLLTLQSDLRVGM